MSCYTKRKTPVSRSWCSLVYCRVYVRAVHECNLQMYMYGVFYFVFVFDFLNADNIDRSKYLARHLVHSDSFSIHNNWVSCCLNQPLVERGRCDVRVNDHRLVSARTLSIVSQIIGIKRSRAYDSSVTPGSTPHCTLQSPVRAPNTHFQPIFWNSIISGKRTPVRVNLSRYRQNNIYFFSF